MFSFIVRGIVVIGGHNPSSRLCGLFLWHLCWSPGSCLRSCNCHWCQRWCGGARWCTGNWFSGCAELGIVYASQGGVEEGQFCPGEAMSLESRSASTDLTPNAEDVGDCKSCPIERGIVACPGGSIRCSTYKELGVDCIFCRDCIPLFWDNFHGELQSSKVVG